MDLIQLLMGESCKSSLSESQVEQLCYGLAVLVSRNLIEWAERLFCDVVIRYSTVVWNTFRGTRLIYVCCLQHNVTMLGTLLIRDMLRTVCNGFLAYYHDNSKSYHVAESQFKRAENILFLKSFREYCKESNVPAAYQIFQSIKKFHRFFFYHLCMTGKYDAVKLVLEVTNAADSQHFLRKPSKATHTPLFFAIINGQLDIVQLLYDSGCPFEGAEDGLMELTAAVLHIRLTKDRLFRPRVSYPYYVSCPLGNRELCGGNFSSEIIDYVVSKSDFELVANNPKLPLLLSEIAALSLCDLSHPILLELASHVRRPLQGSSSSHTDSCDENSMEDELKLILTKLSKRWKQFGNSQYFLDTTLCALFSSCDSDFEIISIASERGFWQLVMKLLPSAMRSDQSVLCILKNLIKQGHHSYFAVVCSELQKDERTFVEGYSDVLCSAVSMCDFHAVVALLSFVGDCKTLIDPLRLSVSRHLNRLADLIISKIVSVGAFGPEQLYTVLNCAARHNNSGVLDKFLGESTQLPDSLENDNREKRVSPLLVVLAEAARYGHKDIALKIATRFSIAELIDMAGREALIVYMRVLCWSCYWGMADVLNRLPVSNEVLLKQPGVAARGKLEMLTPWSYAEGGGSIGKLATVDALNLSEVNEKFSAKRNSNFILMGTFQKFFDLRKDGYISQSHDFDYSRLSSIIGREIFYGGEESIQVLVDHMGAKKPEFFQSVYKLYHCDAIFSTLLKALCNKRDDPSGLLALLKYLISSGINFDENSKTCFIDCVLLGKVAHAQAFIQLMPQLLESFNKTYLLDVAVKSKSPEMVDFIFEYIGDAGAKCCFPNNATNAHDPMVSKLPYPLYTAFSLGCFRVVCHSSLLSMASKVEGFEFCRWTEASACNGWFQFMMEENSKIASQNCNLNVESSATHEIVPQHFSLRSVPMHDYKNSLLQHSTQWGVNAVTMAVLESTGGILEQRDTWSRKDLIKIADILTDKDVLIYLKSQTYCQDILKEFMVQAKDLNVVRIAVNKLKTCQRSRKDMLELVHLFCGLFSDPEFGEKLFLHSCELGLSTIASHFVDTDLFPLSVLHRGLQEAIRHRHYSIMAEIMIKLNISEAAVKEAGGNELAQVVFSKEDYHSILIKFFHSVCTSEGRLPLAAMWLSYQWSRREAELVVKRLGSRYAPPNPWNLSQKHSNLVITIDWNSFSESLLVSPSVTKLSEINLFQFVPMAVEAIVFSPAVFGQVVGSFCNGGKAFDNPKDVALFSKLQGFNNLLITCSTFLAPSLSSMGGGQALLTIAYVPDTRSFIFPEVEVASSLPIPLEVASPVMCFDTVKSLAEFHERKVKSVFKFLLCVSFGTIIRSELQSLLLYSKEGERYYSLLSSILEDFHDALTLNFEYSLPHLKLNKKVVNGVELNLEHESTQQGQPVYSTEVANSILVVKIFMPAAAEFRLETSEICTAAFCNGLVEAVRKAIILEHDRIAESETKTEVERLGKAFSSCFGASFDISINLDNVKPFESKTCTIDEAQCLVVYVRQVKRLKIFLKLFRIMLENCLNIVGNISATHRRALNIVCLGNSESEFVECNYGDFQLTICAQSLINKEKLYDSLI